MTTFARENPKREELACFDIQEDAKGFARNISKRKSNKANAILI